MFGHIDRKIAHAIDGLFLGRDEASHDGAQARENFRGVEGFREVIIRSGVERGPAKGHGGTNVTRGVLIAVGEGLGRGTYGVVQPSEVYQFGREIEALSDWPLVACGEMFVAAVAFYEAWAAPVRRSASDDDATEHETRAVRQFDALVRTNRQQLTRQALSLFV
jgi:hypothetical protein